MCNVEASLLDIHIPSWEWVAGKAKYSLCRKGEDGEPDDGFAIVIRGPSNSRRCESVGYTRRGWEILLCGSSSVIKAGHTPTFAAAKRWGEMLYRSHYGI